MDDSKSPRSYSNSHGGFGFNCRRTSLLQLLSAEGHNCLTFEVLSQDGVIYKQKIPFRYVWERVITPIVDYALTRANDVDPKRKALIIRHGRIFSCQSCCF